MDKETHVERQKYSHRCKFQVAFSCENKIEFKSDQAVYKGILNARSKLIIQGL